MQRDVPIHIAIYSPGPSLDEMAQAYAWALRTQGFNVSLGKGYFVEGSINLLFAGFGLNVSDIGKVTSNVINVNFEQMHGSTMASNLPLYYAVMRKFSNWDYSLKNIVTLAKSGISPVWHIPVGYCPEWECIDNQVEKDIDVLFYGALSNRRQRALDMLKETGLKVVVGAYTDKWSMEVRNAHIARSKMVLNLSCYDDVHVFEEVRVSYLLSNHACVVSEIRDDTYIEKDMRESIALAKMQDLPDLCTKLCANPSQRIEIAQRGLETLKKRDWVERIAAGIVEHQNTLAQQRSWNTRDLDPPQTLNIIDRDGWRHDMLNIASGVERGADIGLNLNQIQDADLKLETWRFGAVHLPENSFERIQAYQVLHLAENLNAYMTNFLHWLKPGGELDLIVPYDLSTQAWQDPRTKRTFNENSLLAYQGQRVAELGWADFCFAPSGLTYILTSNGAQLLDKGVQVEEIAAIPRMVSALQIRLTKRELTASEKASIKLALRPIF